MQKNNWIPEEFKKNINPLLSTTRNFASPVQPAPHMLSRGSFPFLHQREKTGHRLYLIHIYLKYLFASIPWNVIRKAQPDRANTGAAKPFGRF